jgi:hypothetical protein
VRGVGKQRLRHINDSVLSSLKMEGLRFFIFFKNNDFSTVTQLVFRRHFDIGMNGKVPTRQTILNSVTQFRTTASIVDKKTPVRP